MRTSIAMNIRERILRLTPDPDNVESKELHTDEPIHGGKSCQSNPLVRDLVQEVNSCLSHLVGQHCVGQHAVNALKDRVKNLMDIFIKAYLSANPKKNP